MSIFLVLLVNCIRRNDSLLYLGSHNFCGLHEKNIRVLALQQVASLRISHSSVIFRTVCSVKFWGLERHTLRLRICVRKANHEGWGQFSKIFTSCWNTEVIYLISRFCSLVSLRAKLQYSSCSFLVLQLELLRLEPIAALPEKQENSFWK